MGNENKSGFKNFFKNKENTAAFNVNVVNTGNEKQDLMMTMANGKKFAGCNGYFGKPITEFISMISHLIRWQDTSFNYKVKYIEGTGILRSLIWKIIILHSMKKRSNTAFIFIPRNPGDSATPI